ncbi:MAG: FAD-dependent oxidoreductase [Mycobacteriaceae bacterium]|nr:FAD-dependent oxidoreductase [Mycobacteriaceae bacterium]
MTSLWTALAPESAVRLPLTQDRQVDVAVIGGGVTGLATALMLAERGIDVAVVEARHVGAGTTGATTGKVSLLQGGTLQRIARHHDSATVRGYVEANRAGQEWLLRFCEERGVLAEQADATTFALTDTEAETVRAEYAAARGAGLGVELVDSLDMPFPATAAVRLREQTQINPLALVNALAAAIEQHGVAIYESTRVHKIRHVARRGLVLDTTQAELRARAAVLATGVPMLDRGAFFARLTPQRSYLAAFDVDGPLPAGMHLNAGTPTRSLRTAAAPDRRILLVGGNGHTVGRARSPRDAVQDLIAWTSTWFPTAEPKFSWSAQDYLPTTGLPYVGPLLPGQPDILVATGFAKWGLTNGAAAALVCAAQLTGQAPPPWARVSASWRADEMRAVNDTVRANAAVAIELTQGWLGALTSAHGDVIPEEGCGEVTRDHLRPTAISTVDGVTRKVSAVCPHLYGIVRWNDAECTWDCPLHGSRFTPDGAVLEGPAATDLPPRSTDYPTVDSTKESHDNA